MQSQNGSSEEQPEKVVVAAVVVIWKLDEISRNKKVQPKLITVAVPPNLRNGEYQERCLYKISQS